MLRLLPALPINCALLSVVRVCNIAQAPDTSLVQVTPITVNKYVNAGYD